MNLHLKIFQKVALKMQNKLKYFKNFQFSIGCINITL